MQNSSSKGIGPQDHASIGQAAELPGVATGQYVSVCPITLPSPNRPVELQLRVTAPMTGKDLPIVLLSHGQGPSNNLSSLNGYAPTAQFYAAHGFVVIQPTHLSSRSLKLPAGTSGAPMFWRSRVEDMKLILDQLDALEAAVPLIQGRLDRSRIAVFGHSMGSHTAAILLGMRLVDPEDGREVDMAEPRIKTGLLLGAIGSGEGLVQSARENYKFLSQPRFDDMKTPALIVVGGADESTHLTDRGHEWHAEPYRLSPGPKDLLTLSDTNHSFGGISGWDSTDCKLFDEESPEMCAATLRMTVAYLKSKLYDGDKSWDEAREALEGTKLGSTESK